MLWLVVGAALSFTPALLADPPNLMPALAPNSKVAQAVALLGKGQLKQADALFKQVTESEPGYLDASLGRAQIAISEQQLDQADRIVTSVLKHQDNLAEAHNMKGLVLLLRKNTDGARHEFARAIELDPRYVTPRLYLAVLARVSGDYPTAAAQYKQLTVVAPHLPAGYLGQAEAQMLMGHQGDAIKVLESWKTADPQTLTPYQVLANVDITNRKPQDAIKQLQAALVKSPHDSGTLTILATAYMDAGDRGSAAAQYQAALAANGSNTDAAMRLGELEAGTGQTDKAISHFRLVLTIDPNNVIASNNIAFLLAEEGKNLDEALRLSQIAVKRSPKYADARDTLGWVLYQRGQYAQAVVTLKEAKALAPTNGTVAAHLGLAYAKAGQKQEALGELKRALSSGGTGSSRPEVERVVAQLSTNHPGSNTSTKTP